jgi:hypothetical protein
LPENQERVKNMKKIWMTSLDSSKETVQKIMAQMKTYGLEMDGHFWKDDLGKLAWAEGREELTGSNIALWVILASEKQLFTPSNLYGLSLLAITLQAKRGAGFPVVILQTEGDQVTSEKLPTVLKGADVLLESNPSLGPKLVAKVHAPVQKVSSEYRMDVYGKEQIGQWFEVGPVDASWNGAMLGVSGAEIIFQAVGPKGELPRTSELNYPVKGMKINLGDKEYTAWALQNEIDSDTSYFVKVDGFPESIIFGSYSNEEDAEVYVVGLK